MSKLDDSLVGDAAREKWIAFWEAAVKTGYLFPEDYSEGLGRLLVARTGTDILEVIRVLPKEELNTWEDLWEKRRQKGIARFPEVTALEPEFRHWVVSRGRLLAWAVSGVGAFIVLGLMVTLLMT